MEVDSLMAQLLPGDVDGGALFSCEEYMRMMEEMATELEQHERMVPAGPEGGPERIYRGSIWVGCLCRMSSTSTSTSSSTSTRKSSTSTCVLVVVVVVVVVVEVRSVN